MTEGSREDQPERMTDRPVELDDHRGMAAQRETEDRRLRHGVQAAQMARRTHQDEIENFMLAADAATWSEAAAKARFVIELYAATPEAQDPRRQKLIARVLADLARLSQPGNGAEGVD